jgi:hypothetical protein
MIPAHRAIIRMRRALAEARVASEREEYLAIVATMVSRHGEPVEIHEPEQRDSVLPPVLAGNQETRATASKHFQETRRILSGIK